MFRFGIPVAALLSASIAAPSLASQDFTARSSASAIITAAGPVRAAITRKIESQKSLAHAGDGFALPHISDRERQYSLEAGHITSSGTIVGYNNKYGVVVILEPTYEQGKTEWRCKVLPASAASRECQ